MTFAYTCSYTPMGDFGPTAEQRHHQNQRDSLHGMKQQHNSCVLLDKKEAYGSAGTLCSPGYSLATPSAAADPLPVSTPPDSSHWTAVLLAANHVLELQEQAIEKSSQSFLIQHQQRFCPSLVHQYPTLKSKITNVLSQASSSFQAQQNRNHSPVQLHYSPQGQIKLLKKQHVMASTDCFLMNEFPLTEHVEAKLYPPIAPLSETLLPLQGIQAGAMGASVGLLPGRCSTIMGKYLPSTEKQRRAMKEDLSGLTAEEKVERRKIRARMYNRLSRHRRDQLHNDLRSDVKRMEIYKDIVDDAPDMMCVISPDIQSHVLYINKAARRVLQTEPAQLVGSSFRDIVHTEDKMALFKAFTAVTTFKSAKKMERLHCRVVANYPGVYVSVRMTLANGVQGIVCVMCHEDPLPANLRVSPNGRTYVM